MNKVKVSVVVPVYKVEKYLERCVNSIIKQSLSELEIILVDDGSPDNCGIMCDSFADKDNRIKVVHKANGGLSSARNAGLKIATGEYIGFVDSDDDIEIDMYEKCIMQRLNIKLTLLCAIIKELIVTVLISTKHLILIPVFMIKKKSEAIFFLR